jgi:hypothetical protein
MVKAELPELSFSGSLAMYSSAISNALLYEERRRLERFVAWLQGGRPGQARDLYHTVKSHSVANSGTKSGCNSSKDSGACGLYPILEYHFFRNSLLG